MVAEKAATQVPPKKTLSEKFQAARNSKSVRLWLLFILLAVVLYMYFFVGKMKGFLLVIMVILASAIGLQLTDRDLDLETLWNTQSFTEARVEQVK
jgi:ABC-type long-subunit fatty acid transport system fused permease/ATPase subunit